MSEKPNTNTETADAQLAQLRPQTRPTKGMSISACSNRNWNRRSKKPRKSALITSRSSRNSSIGNGRCRRLKRKLKVTLQSGDRP